MQLDSTYQVLFMLHAHQLGHQLTFPKVHTRNQSHCLFIQYGLNHYQ